MHYRQTKNLASLIIIQWSIIEAIEHNHYHKINVMAVYCVLLQYLVSILQGQKHDVKYFKLAPIIQTLVAISCLCIQTGNNYYYVEI